MAAFRPKLVDREQLRFRSHGRYFSAPKHLKAAAALPTPPKAFSWAKGIEYPLWGNDRLGDCYYVACCKAARTFNENNGRKTPFDEADLTARYMVISGGDNGLDDRSMMPEWEAGLVGPNGPHRILDQLTIDPNDDAAVAFALWAGLGLIWTAALPDKWISNPRPGQIWTAGRPNRRNGHAMLLTGKDGNFEVQTWGLDPPIYVTPDGIKNADSELIVVFSLEQFNEQGMLPCGLGYDQAADIWQQYGGQKMPANPFVNRPPSPPVKPPITPPLADDILFSLNFPSAWPANRPFTVKPPVSIPGGRYDVVPHVNRGMVIDVVD